MNKIFKKKFEKKAWQPLRNEWEEFFRDHGMEGNIVPVNLKAPSHNWLSRAIGYFERGFSHTVPIFHGSLRECLTDYEIRKVQKSLENYYIMPPSIDDVSTWIIGSADENGLNWFDFSRYQDRGMTIYRPRGVTIYRPRLTIAKETTQKMLSYAVDMIGTMYDGTGLLMKLLNKFKVKIGALDDPDAPFCSEYTQDLFDMGGIKISKEKNTGPGAIDKYLSDLVLKKC